MRIIDADALIYSLSASDEDMMFERIINEFPTVDPMVYGKWEICSNGYYPYCSNCKNEPKSGIMTNFCPECGAKMKLRDNRHNI